MSFLGKFTGLMFKTRDTENLLFEFARDVRTSIHSFFVFFPFLAIWLDGKNRIIERRVVKPFLIDIKPKKEFRKLIEIPINEKNKFLINKLINHRRIF